MQVYNRLPGPLRSVAATARGYQLRSWRYGPETEALMAQAIERESWPAEKWKSWREERLARFLHRAATRVPYYRSLWEERRKKGDKSDREELSNWPILEKESIRAHPEKFVADDVDRRLLFADHTSGTTGKPLTIWMSRATVRAWYAIFEARARQWNGVSRNDPWAILGGQMVVPTSQRTAPFWVWNSALNQLYMSSYHLAPDLIPKYLDAIKDYNIVYAYAYTSSLYAIAQEANRVGRDDVRLKVALTNAEPVHQYQREAIERAFRCPVRETYGMSEIVTAAGECSARALHIWPDVGVTEILEGDQPVPHGQSGDIVATGLLNPDMPLVRYRVGDRGSLKPDTEICACDRMLPRFSSIEGRQDDVLVTADGRRIGRLDPVFKADLPIREAQIVQESLEEILVRYVPAPGFTPECRDSIVRRVRERLGDVRVSLQELDSVPRTANGKFRAVISKVESP